jgi:hypothetical protein
MKFPQSIRRAIMLAALFPLLLCLGAVASASAASASTSAASASVGTSNTGWIRLAHLSPNTPAVDVYLYSFGNSSAQLVLHHVAYGTVSPYLPLTAGDYSVAMRAAGAAATTKPVLSTSVNVVAGHAYTVAGLGPESGLRLQVLDDQLATPHGQALVRVIQASLKQQVVTVTYGGQVLASDLAFASVSGYQAVSPASGLVRVTVGGGDVSSSVTFAAGSVYTLVVLDGAKGLVVDALIDAAGSGDMPAGAAHTGFGGTAPHGPPSPLPWVALIGAGLLLALGGGLRLRRVLSPRF